MPLPHWMGLCLALTAVSCSGEEKYQGPPVVVIGIDGMTWDVAATLVEQGRMPHMAALLERGVGGDLETFVPTYSPVLWTTIATGKPTKEHGIRYFSEIGPNGQPLRDGLPYTSNSRQVPAIWNLASAAGRKVDSVAWWVSWPAEQIEHGNIVASYAAQAQANVLWKPLVWEEGIPELTWPPQLQEDIAPILDAGRPKGELVKEYNERFGLIDKGWKVPYQREILFRGTYHADVTHKRIFQQLIRDKGLADLSLLYFGLPDVAGHFFWRYREPDAYHYRVPPVMVKRIQDHIDKAYIAVDDWIGEIVADLPEDTIIMLISDHGMGPANLNYEKAAQSGAHEDGPPGIFVLAGPQVKPQGLLPADNRAVGDLLDVVPTLLDLLRIPAEPGMSGQSMRALLTQVWQDEHENLPARITAVPFRAATAPREPQEGLSEDFFNAVDQLGYTESSSGGISGQNRQDSQNPN